MSVNENIGQVVYPNFFHIGLMKTGTTTIQNLLLTDHRINLILKKKFFNSNLYFLDKYKFCKNGRLNIESDEQLLTIDNFYSGSSIVLKRIKEKVPNAKLIITIREQRSLLISAYKHSIRFKRTYYKNFDDFLNSKEGNIFMFITDYNHLYNQLLNYFPKENIHIMLYEDLKNDYDNFFNEFYNIIGLSRMELNENIKSNVGWPDKLIEFKSFLNRIKLFNKGKRRVYLSNYQYNFSQEFKFFSFVENYIYNGLIKFYSFIIKANHRKKTLLKYQWGSSELCLKLEEHFKETNKGFHKKSGINIYKYNYL